MTLHRGQIDAISRYVKAISVYGYGAFSPLDGADYQHLESQFLKATPWKEILNKSDFLDIVYEAGCKTLVKLPADYVGRLATAPDGAEVERLFEAELSDALQTLPRNYRVYFPFGCIPHLMLPEIEICPGISIVDTHDGLQNKEKLLEGRLANLADIALHGEVSPWASGKLKRDMRYICIDVVGYASEVSESAVTSNAIAQLKQIIFLGIAHGVWQRVQLPKHNIRLGLKEGTPVHAVLHYERKGLDESFGYVLTSDMFHLLHGLELRRDRLTVVDYENGKTILGASERAPNTHEEFEKAFLNKLADAVLFIHASLDNQDAIRIKAAIEWYVDAFASPNKTVSFLQYCIGFEALLGEMNSDRGVTDRLSDRYAYLIGRTSSERQALKDRFEKIYGKRSAIVHQREKELPSDGGAAEVEVGRMLADAILREIRLFSAANSHKA